MICGSSLTSGELSKQESLKIVCVGAGVHLPDAGAA